MIIWVLQIRHNSLSKTCPFLVIRVDVLQSVNEHRKRTTPDRYSESCRSVLLCVPSSNQRIQHKTTWITPISNIDYFPFDLDIHKPCIPEVSFKMFARRICAPFQAQVVKVVVKLE